MDISKFQPLQPPPYIKQIMTDVVFLNHHNYLKVDKPKQLNTKPMAKPEIVFKNFEKVIQPKISVELKTKLIKKLKSEQINVKKQKKFQRMLNLHLLNILNKSMVQSVKNGELPLLSCLDTKEEGDFLHDEERKEYPHFSNCLKVTQIPNELLPKSYIPKLKKLTQPIVFNIEDKRIYKVKQVYRFAKILYKIGNEEFNRIGEQMELSTSHVKLLYDFFNDYFNIQRGLEMKDEMRGNEISKAVKLIKSQLIKSLEYKKKEDPSSVYKPFEEEFVSLREIRKYVNMKRDDDNRSD